MAKIDISIGMLLVLPKLVIYLQSFLGYHQLSSLSRIRKTPKKGKRILQTESV